MKKIIIALLCLVLTIGIICFILWNNRTISTITLDINPSLQINIKKDNIVKKVVPLNNEANDIINKNMSGKNLDNVLKELTDNISKASYVDDGDVNILLYSTGDINDDEIKKTIEDEFNNNRLHAQVIIIDSVSSEDIELSKKYNISPSKASYINSIVKDKEIEVTNIINETVNELNETKQSGNYCEDGYTLKGDFCLKEIKREKAEESLVCPDGYFEYKNKCYEEVESYQSDKLICDEEFTLEKDSCYKKIIEDAKKEYECKTGELVTDPHGLKRGVKTPVCVDKTNAKAPKLRCLIGPHKVINGKCYVGPAPVINGGCPNNDKKIGGGCYSLDPEDQWQCPNGDIYEKSKGSYVELCPDTFKYTSPTISRYYCNDDFTLENNKCIMVEKRKAYYENYCDSNYTRIDNRCINRNNIKEKIDGYICSMPNSNIKNDICIIYDIIDAKH